jgi:hypothetical protein
VSEPLTAEEIEALRTWDTDRMAPFTVGTILATLDAARDRPGLAALDLNSERGTSVATEHPLSERLAAAQQREAGIVDHGAYVAAQQREGAE